MNKKDKFLNNLDTLIAASGIILITILLTLVFCVFISPKAVAVVVTIVIIITCVSVIALLIANTIMLIKMLRGKTK